MSIIALKGQEIRERIVKRLISSVHGAMVQDVKADLSKTSKIHWFNNDRVNQGRKYSSQTSISSDSSSSLSPDLQDDLYDEILNELTQSCTSPDMKEQFKFAPLATNRFESDTNLQKSTALSRTADIFNSQGNANGGQGSIITNVATRNNSNNNDNNRNIETDFNNNNNNNDPDDVQKSAFVCNRVSATHQIWPISSFLPNCQLPFLGNERFPQFHSGGMPDLSSQPDVNGQNGVIYGRERSVTLDADELKVKFRRIAGRSYTGPESTIFGNKRSEDADKIVNLKGDSTDKTKYVSLNNRLARKKEMSQATVHDRGAYHTKEKNTSESCHEKTKKCPEEKARRKKVKARIVESNKNSRREKQYTRAKKLPKLLRFLKMSIENEEKYQCLQWTDKATGTFKITSTEALAHLWGVTKRKPNMKYEHLARTLRGYVGRGLLRKPRKKLIYQFADDE
ncbi:uncharacterized protein DDB_G0288805-like isoform X2 [Rhopilema esculentum]|uniref:uncharacterized protein DDB_G0288805-like isoform X2 n=1 Tax=Rhopilema esculentum TaxID=499914 RepID=UPI0031CEA11E